MSRLKKRVSTRRLARTTLLQRHAQLRSLAGRPAVEFLDHRSGPLGVDLSWCVLAFSEHHVTPLVDEVSHLALVRHLLRKLGGDERHTLGVANRNISRHHRSFTNADRHVNAGQHDVLQGRGINSANETLESFDLLNTGLITDRAIYDQPVVALGVNRGSQIVADDRAVANLAEQVHDQDVSRLENVDDPRVLVANTSFFFAVGLNDRVDIRTARHEHRRDDAADQAFAWVNDLPTRFILVAKARLLQRVPCFFGSYAFQALEHLVGYLRASV